jgi:hypothetical protein
MALEGKIAYISEPLNYYRSHSENVRTRMEAGGLVIAEYISVMLWVVTQVAQTGTLPEEAKRVFVRPVTEMAPHERIQASIKAMEYIAKWNLRYNPHVPRNAVRSRFVEWRLALYEREFAISAPSRWRYFLYKCDFYRCYFPLMSWNAKLLNLIKLAGATAVGYNHRRNLDRAYGRVTRMLGTPRQKS